MGQATRTEGVAYLVRQQHFASEFVGLRLVVGWALASYLLELVHEDCGWVMKEQVGGLMVEREPEVIVGQIPSA